MQISHALNMNSIYTIIYMIFCHCCIVNVTCLRPALDPECPRLELIKSNPTKFQHFQTLDNTLFSSAKMQEQFEPLRNDLLLRAARGIYFGR